ncbi:DeoR/GlpR family DNA-binding transcription regulator [Actinosynnema mirum]|uniref:DeoR/GlpR family DNA-binding transcription regulator n=1 Tax=Actinosynnema mirum TaxID=40567 RepID=UPI00165113C5|nr:DeoR/GlpR family DNA-binding transcription regulator [Actinosynnema mirum]
MDVRVVRVFARERQERIVAELRRDGRVEVSALAVLLGVSEDTVRRDLRALSEAGHLQKTHGGAVALDTGRMGWAARAGVAGDAKRAIARAAAGLVRPGQVLLLDAGSTVLAFAEALRVRPVTVVTNSLDVAGVFDGDGSVALSVTGGRWDPVARYLVGSAAVGALGRYRADWAVLGACALDVEVGMTSVSEADADVKSAMAGAARRVAVLADSTKHGQVAPHFVLPPGGVGVLVTEDVEAGASWGEAGVEVVVA